MFVTGALIAAAVATPALAAPRTPHVAVPKLLVPACPKTGSVTYDKTVPDLAPFPKTQVDVCYSSNAIEFKFTAYDETSFYFQPNYTTNGNIWEYEVMEAFISKGTDDPSTYLEIEVAPNNVTFQAFIYNPSKVRAAGAPFDHAFIGDIAADGLAATTTTDVAAKTWVSTFDVPLALFNVDAGKAKGTKWRMNFFRTTTSPETFPDQGLGAWSPPDAASFHMTPFFGNVIFV
ncbi:hypothetical protein BKA62DRAFT_611587 [Auriculariales sp. MPI-PUGE-AT-0066]|nr:hypothetical protein BKA62DRAFT_611587 [Auriculariales sp. MPI-PUGE-AT-0066]